MRANDSTNDRNRREVGEVESVIEVRDLTRDFGSKRALDAINLTVPRGARAGRAAP